MDDRSCASRRRRRSPAAAHAASTHASSCLSPRGAVVIDRPSQGPGPIRRPSRSGAPPPSRRLDPGAGIKDLHRACPIARFATTMTPRSGDASASRREPCGDRTRRPSAAPLPRRRCVSRHPLAGACRRGHFGCDQFATARLNPHRTRANARCADAYTYFSEWLLTSRRSSRRRALSIILRSTRSRRQCRDAAATDRASVRQTSHTYGDVRQ